MVKTKIGERIIFIGEWQENQALGKISKTGLVMIIQQ